VTVLQVCVGVVVLQRAVEVVLARRQATRLRARGGVESGRGHYPFLVVLHVAWLVSVLRFGAAPLLPLLGVYAFLQGLRYWTVHSLGEHMTTRVICVPGDPLVRRGPYRFLRHPLYLLVAAEIAVLPAAFHAWRTALVFSLLNAVLLARRIRIEERALRADGHVVPHAEEGSHAS